MAFDAIVDSAADAIITVDGDQRIIVFNRAAEEMFGFDRSEVIAAPLSVVLPIAEADRHEGLVRAFIDSGDTSRPMAGRVVEGIRPRP